MAEVNPLATLQGFEWGANLMSDRLDRDARQRAGLALSQGDYGAAGQALGGRGMLGEQVELMGAQRDQETAEQEQVIAFLGNAGRSLRAAPYEARPQIYQSIRPTLQQIYPPDVLAQLDRTDLTDQNLDALLRSLGEYGETQRFNTREGVVEVDPYGGSRNLYEIEQAPPAAPAGFRWTQDGNLEPIPGGPADPAIIARRSAAGRAPPRPRSSGGGRSGGGQGAPPPPPTRGGLPPGFTVRRRGS